MNTVNITDLIERQRPNRTTVSLLILSFLIMLCDGYDLQAIAFASPTIVSDWGIEKASLGFVFSAGLFGIMLGGFLFGYVADRIGRRPAFLLGTLLFGVAHAEYRIGFRPDASGGSPVYRGIRHRRSYPNLLRAKR